MRESIIIVVSINSTVSPHLFNLFMLMQHCGWHFICSISQPRPLSNPGLWLYCMFFVNRHWIILFPLWVLSLLSHVYHYYFHSHVFCDLNRIFIATITIIISIVVIVYGHTYLCWCQDGIRYKTVPAFAVMCFMFMLLIYLKCLDKF